MKDSFVSLNLDQIRIASPCNARWEDMAGDERARFCGSCRKNVYNLSAMTQPEITTLVREKEGQFCGRFYQRPDGRMLTADCPEGGRRRRDRIARVCRAAFAAVLVLFGVKIQANAEDTNKASGTKQCVMGDIAGPPPMGMVAPLPATNKPVASTNAPPREIMGKIAAPKQTNTPVKIKD